MTISTNISLRGTSEGTSNPQARFEFFTYAPLIIKICTSLQLQTSTQLSLRFVLTGYRSLGFGLSSRDFGGIRTERPPYVRRIRFPYASANDSLRLATKSSSRARVSRRIKQRWSGSFVRNVAVPCFSNRRFLMRRLRSWPHNFRHFSLPFLGAFHHSFTVLLRYRTQFIFRLPC